MLDIQLDSNGDILLSENGDVALTPDTQTQVQQRLAITLKTWQGEWALDTTYGTPYRQSILGKPRTQEEIDAIFIGIINSDPDVQSIDFFTSEFNSDNSRHYDLEFGVVVDNVVTPVTVLEAPSEEWIYPIPDPQSSVFDCPPSDFRENNSLLDIAINNLWPTTDFVADRSILDRATNALWARVT